MKSSLSVPCHCGERVGLQISGSQLPKYALCSKCGAHTYLVAPLGNIVTALVMERVKKELENNDATVAIMLSAIAVEGQMSYLFFKWKKIDSGKLSITHGDEDKGEWEKEWDEMRSIGKRLDELSRYLTDFDFDKFAKQNKMWLFPTLKKFNPANSVKKFLQEQLFERRNRIVHFGYLDFEKEQADECFTLTLALIRLLDAMDKVRIKRMDDAHERQRTKLTTEPPFPAL